MLQRITQFVVADENAAAGAAEAEAFVDPHQRGEVLTWTRSPAASRIARR